MGDSNNASQHENKGISSAKKPVKFLVGIHTKEIPKTRRACTDKFFLLLILLTWAASLIIGLSALGVISTSSWTNLHAGDPDLITHGIDYEGNTCGFDLNKGSPLTFQPNLSGDNYDSLGSIVPPLLVVCVNSCPKEGDIVVDPYGNYGEWTVESNTRRFLNMCSYVSQTGYSVTSSSTIYADFMTAIPIIAGCGFGLAIVLSLLYLLILRVPYLLLSIVWCCILVITFLWAFAAYILLKEASSIRVAQTTTISPTELDLMNGIGIVLAICGVLWVIFIYYNRKNITLAANLVKASAAAIGNMTLLCFLPFAQVVLFAGTTALWLYWGVYLVSSADIGSYTDPTTGFSIAVLSFDVHCKRAVLFLVFGWFWSIALIEAMGQLVSSHAVTRWYFAAERSDINSISVLGSIQHMTRYHLGTAAIGSLIIALFRVVRISFEFLKARLKSKRAVQNCLLKVPLCIASCMLWFLERVLKFLNKHAYIQCAMFGTSFFTSARFAFKLIVRNLGRTAAVGVVGDLVVLVGKVLIAFVCSIASYYYMTHYMKNQFNGFVMQTLLVAFVAFFTSTLFLGVLSGSADTLLQASIVEEEIHKSDEKCRGESNALSQASVLSDNRTLYSRHVEQHEDLHKLVIDHADEWRVGTYDEDEDEDAFYDYIDEDEDEEQKENNNNSNNNNSVYHVEENVTRNSPEVEMTSARNPMPQSAEWTSSSGPAVASISKEANNRGKREFGRWTSSSRY